MADYTNTIPASPKAGDRFIISKNGNYVLPRGVFKFEVASAGGGKGDNMTAYTNASGNTASFSGGNGGQGLLCSFNYTLTANQNSIAIVCGIRGATYNPGGIMGVSYQGSHTGQTGGMGALSRATINGTMVAEIQGGSGGIGARISIGSTTGSGLGWSRTVTGSDGDPGFPGKVLKAPTGYTTAINPSDGFVRITAMSLNRAPSAPAPITYDTPQSGRSLALNCGKSTDPDGDSITYVWEVKVNAGAFTTAGTSTTNSRTVTVPSSGTTITYRVKAVDSYGAESAYATGSAKTIQYNYPPVISGSDGDRGKIGAPFSYDFTVHDPDVADVLAVQVYLDRVENELMVINNAAREQTYTIDLTASWETIPMGKHTLVITARDDKGGTASRTIGFERSSNKLEVRLREVIELDELVTTLLPFVNYAANNDAILKITVKNDPAAAWEDCTSFNYGSELFEFVNESKTTSPSQLMIRVSIEKGASGGDIFFFGGSFVLNANGIDVSYAKGVRINPADIVEGGALTGKSMNVMSALNEISIAATGIANQVKDRYSTVAELQAAHPTGSAGDMYAVYNSGLGKHELYIWGAGSKRWQNIGNISGIMGESGKDGKDGKDGKSGSNAEFRHVFSSESALKAALPTGSDGLAIVGDELTVYFWDSGQAKWAKTAGMKGEQGVTGQPGSQIIWATGKPAASAGRDGDWAIDTNSEEGAFYEKNSGSWVRRYHLRGKEGKAFAIKGTYSSIAELSNKVLNPQQGDVYNIGAVVPYTAYMWDAAEGGDWIEQGKLQGSSAYQLWLEAGNAGTMEEFFESIKGEPGEPGKAGASSAEQVSVDSSKFSAEGCLETEHDTVFKALDALGVAASRSKWTESPNGVVLRIGDWQICLTTMIDNADPYSLSFMNIYVIADNTSATCCYALAESTIQVGKWTFPARFADKPYVFNSIRDDRKADGNLRIQFVAIGKSG